MATTIGNLKVILGLDSANFDAGTKNVRKATAQLQRDVRKFGFQAGDVGRALTAGITLPLAGIGVAATKMATDLNKSMANVATLIPNNTERVVELKRAVQDTAVATATSTDTISQGLFQLVSAFGDSAESAKLLDLNARAARAGLATVSDSINLTSAVTKGYGDTSFEASQKVVDLAFVTNKLGQTTFPELAKSLGKVVPLSAELKVSQEELFAVMATATGVTGNTAEVSTQLRGVFQSLLDPTKQLSGLLEDLEVASGEALLEQKGLAGAIDLIVAEAEKTGTPLSKYIRSIEGQTLALALAGSQSDAFRDKLAAMSEATGAADEAFLQQTDGLNKVGFTWEQVTQRMAVFSQRLGDVLLPIVSRLLDLAEPVLTFLEGMLERFESLSPGVQTAVVAVAALAAAVGPLLIVVGFLATSLAPLVPLLAGVAAALTGPVGLIAAALALGTTFAVLSDDTDSIWGTIKSTISGVLDALGDLFSTVAESFHAIWATHGAEITSTFQTIWGTISSVLAGAMEAIKGILVGALKVLEGAVKLFAGVLTGDFSLMGEGLKTIWSGIWTAIKGIFSGIVKAITGIYETWAQRFAFKWDELKGRLLKIWETLWNSITSFITGVLGSIISKVAGFTEKVTGLFRSMFDEVVGNSIVPDMMGRIQDEFGRLPGIMVDPSQRSTIATTGNFREMFMTVKDLARDWKQNLVGFFGGVVDALTSGKGLKNSFRGALDGLLGNFKGVFDSIVSAAKNWKQSLFSILGSVLDGLSKGLSFGSSLLQGFGSLIPGLGGIIPGLGGLGTGGAAAGAGAAGAGGGGGLGALGGFLTNPFTLATIGALLGGGFLLNKFLNNPARLGAKETLRDFNIDIGKGDIDKFLSAQGISKKEFEPIRKDILSSPAFFRDVLLPAAQASGNVDQLVAAFGRLEAFGRTFDLSAAAADAVAGDFTKLNEQWSELFGSGGLPRFLPTWEKLLTDTTNRVLSVVEKGENALSGDVSEGVTQPENIRSGSLGTGESTGVFFPAEFEQNLSKLDAMSKAFNTSPSPQVVEIHSEPNFTIDLTLNAKDPDLAGAVRDQVVPELQLLLKTGTRGFTEDIVRAVERARFGVRS